MSPPSAGPAFELYTSHIKLSLRTRAYLRLCAARNAAWTLWAARSANPRRWGRRYRSLRALERKIAGDIERALFFGHEPL